ncbi:MAG: TRAM domain-containing protein [bacterium]|nr:TRAM domain-containing protein [bacterium]
MFERRSFAPVKVDDELDVKIEAVGEKGDGIAKKDGFVLFVPNTNEGDEVRIKVTKVLKKVGFAEVVGAGSAPKEDAPEGEAAEPAPADAPAEEEQKEEAPKEGEDSYDFGEDLEKK